MTLCLYLDDSVDSGEYRLRLAAAGHEVVSPRDVGMVGKDDRLHLEYAARHGLALLTYDADDFEELHLAGEQHSGVLVVYFDNNRRRDMRPSEVVRAIEWLEASGLPIAGELHVLNHWRS